jgi:hypothetical protein
MTFQESWDAMVRRRMELNLERARAADADTNADARFSIYQLKRLLSNE